MKQMVYIAQIVFFFFFFGQITSQLRYCKLFFMHFYVINYQPARFSTAVHAKSLCRHFLERSIESIVQTTDGNKNIFQLIDSGHRSVSQIANNSPTTGTELLLTSASQTVLSQAQAAREIRSFSQGSDF